MSIHLVNAIENVAEWTRRLSESLRSLLTQVDYIEKDQRHMRRRLEEMETRLRALEKGEKEND